MSFSRPPVRLLLAPALIVLALAGCTSASAPAPTPTAAAVKDVIGGVDPLKAIVGAPTDQLLVAKVAEAFANLQLIAQNACAQTMMGEAAADTPARFDAQASAYTAAEAAVVASGQPTAAGVPAKLPAPVAGDWCATSGALTAAAGAG